ncbi:phage tail assembly chaperone G [Escherichia coli]|uniref:phage tail assembly chaperone G n=3 Tax=Escherichia coli TaxID=562 RepID=UPI0013022EF9|nr:phage minor tail protein G [Escherichia coli]KAE9790463.1 phage minor tail protein G [Escherichia coli]MWN28009.1 phage minor tail protein G [Escherichia coli]MWN44208.1 phage minor tail protein G [Escherichia coli]MWN48732.1 phage minor tail protein G [Escherichia coli]MWN62891.1 phage minor tail protein G [Escherichia coli]
MFLKTEPFEYNGQTVTLSELSALQRLEYLARVKEKEEQRGEAVSEQQALDELIREGAALVAMSLWHNHALKGTLPSLRQETDRIMQEVLTTWPVEAIAAGRNVAVRLSGMSAPVDEPSGKQEKKTAEPVTAKKRTKAS